MQTTKKITFKHFHDAGADYIRQRVHCPICIEHNMPNNMLHTNWLHYVKRTELLAVGKCILEITSGAFKKLRHH